MNKRVLFKSMALFAASHASASDEKFSLSDVHASRNEYKKCLVKQAARLDDRRSEPSEIAEGARSSCKAERRLFVIIISLWLSDDKAGMGEGEALRRAERLGIRYDAEVRADVVRAVLENRATNPQAR